MLALMTNGAVKTVTPIFAASHISQPTFHVLPGHVIPTLKGVAVQHATAKNNILHLAVSLTLRNQADLTALIAAQNDSNSAYYQHFLTPQQFTSQFGPTQTTVNQVVNFLRSQGLAIDAIAPNNVIIDATGTVAQVEKAFKVTINNYYCSGHIIYAPANNPSVPDALGNAIQSIAGLNNIPWNPQSSIYINYKNGRKKIRPLIGPGGGYTPNELRTAYGADSLINAGYSGTGQTVAIFELDGYKPSDVDTYLSTYNLGPAKYSNVLVDGATNTPGDSSIEVVLDMEAVSALAPNAAQKIYIGPNNGSGVNDTYNRIVTDNLAKVTSISWGLCEPSSGNAELAALDNIFAQGAAQGQAFFAASGDTGAYDCRGDTTTLAIDSPASDPYVVGVGGTHLLIGTGGTYASESAWSNVSNGTGGGGGISSYFTRPGYQTGINLTNTHRMVPDISADADPSTGYSVYCTAAAVSYCSGWLSIGGTSAAAPLWAAIASDINHYLIAQSKPVLGNAHVPLYNLYNNAQVYPPFHDITTGNNLYYQATANYDLATGLGTPNSWNMARDLATGTIPTPTPSPTPVPTLSPTPVPTLTPSPTPLPLPDLTIQQIHAGGSNLGIGQTLSEQISISSLPSAGAVSGSNLVHMVAVLPVGLKNVTVSGSNWSIIMTGALSPILISATYIGTYPVLPGTILPPIRLSGIVASAVGIAITDTAVVQTPGDRQSANNLATDTFVTVAQPTLITPLSVQTTIPATLIPLTLQALPLGLPNLQFQLTHNGNTFYVGQAVTSTLTVSNVGPQPFNTGSQLLHLTGVIPVGFSNLSISGTNWQVTTTANTSPILFFATYTGVTQIPIGQSLPPILITGTLTTGGQPSITSAIYLNVDTDSYPQNNFTIDTIGVLPSQQALQE
ncbi:hypothetical protein KDA_71280 [Dictyobacter alpinus]|uniref:Peptidase S53 domain-containing protein n=2 Tax=Dictyobacter alpinus TaxID=2014873 RepID=A0A402BJX6_9CHLR|nr:hypothetical protein KDA_71280 [Dictyobacter alpinus]